MDTKTKLLNATLKIVREKGYSDTSLTELCAEAGVSRGAFFHHFKGKEALGVAAAAYWSATTGAFFAAAPYHEPDDPLDRFLGYIDFRKAILQGEPAEFTCFAGTTVQEAFKSSDDLRVECRRAIFDHAETLESDIEAAMEQHGIAGDWTAKSLALHTQAVLQGAFVLAKADCSAEVAVESVRHLRRYVELLFDSNATQHQRR